MKKSKNMELLESALHVDQIFKDLLKSHCGLNCSQDFGFATIDGCRAVMRLARDNKNFIRYIKDDKDYWWTSDLGSSVLGKKVSGKELKMILFGKTSKVGQELWP